MWIRYVVVHLKKALISIRAKCWILEMKTCRNVDRPSLGVRAPLAMILGALERWDAQLSPGSNQVENFWSMLEKIDFEIWPEIFFGRNFRKIEKSENRKSKKQGFQLKIFENQDFRKFRFSKNFNWNPCFFDFSIFENFVIFFCSRKKWGNFLLDQNFLIRSFLKVATTERVLIVFCGFLSKWSV